jgi:hypothetical protein
MKQEGREIKKPLYFDSEKLNQVATADPGGEVSVMEALREAPEELLWKANFNSDNSVDTYDRAIRTFLDFLGISSPEELRSITHGHVIAFKNFLQDQGRTPAPSTTASPPSLPCSIT